MPKIHEQIRDLPVPANERASFKGQEIARLVKSVPRTNVKFSGADYDIEIVSIEHLGNGALAAFARAWTSDGKQVGFGSDGSVDIERFIVPVNGQGANGYLTYLVVPDPNGDIEVKSKRIRVNEDGSDTVEFYTERFREDPKENMLRFLAHTILVKQQKHDDSRIIKGKIGNTTTTIKPDANPETNSFDGRALRTSAGETLAVIRAGAGTDSDDTAANASLSGLQAAGGANNFNRMDRGILGFSNFSPATIPADDTIDSVVLSIYNITAPTDNGDDAVIDRRVPGSVSAIANSDFNIAGWDGVEQAARVDITSIGANAYWSATLNATGRGNLSRTAVSWYGVRMGADFDNVSVGDVTNFIGDAAYVDNADSNKHPKLVVEHSAAVNRSPGGGVAYSGSGQYIY